MLRLKRIARYVQRFPEEIYEFRYQAQPDRLIVYADSDWATCQHTRKSVSSLSVRLGSHLIESSCARQTLVALSSGEAEFYAIVRSAAKDYR